MTLLPFYFIDLLLELDSGLGATCRPRALFTLSTHRHCFTRYRHTCLFSLITAWWDTIPHANATPHPVFPASSTWRHFTPCPPPFYIMPLLDMDSGLRATCCSRLSVKHSTHRHCFTHCRHQRLISLSAATTPHRVGVG